MKKNYFLFLLLCITGLQSLLAQTPASFNYQAVPRRQDSLLYNAGETLQFRFQIRQGTGSGTVVFAETNNLTVNRQGAVSTAIGLGTPISGVPHDLLGLDWGTFNYYLSVSVDVNNNSSFENNENFGTTQLLSVPYAMYAAQSGNGGSDEQTLSVSGNQLSISNGNTVDLPTEIYQAGSGIYIGGQTINAYDESPDNELQTLSIAGNQLTISQGNTITLPSGGGGGGGLTLPYNGNGSNNTFLFKITNTGGGSAIHGITHGGADAAVVGEDPTGGLAGVRGYSSGSYGVLGFSDSGIGVLGQSSTGTGVSASSSSPSGIALEATNLFGGKAGAFSGLVNISNLSGTALDVHGPAIFNDGLTIGSAEDIKDGGSYVFEFNGTLRSRLDGADNLGTASYRWNTVYATNGTINTSDATLKRDIKPLNYGINEVMKLQPVSYQWIDGRPGEGRIMGFLAQDLQKVIPEVVRDKEWVYEKEDRSAGHWQPAAKLCVAYSEIIPVAVAAIQEQQKEIDALRAELEASKKQNQDQAALFRAELEAMSQQITTMNLILQAKK